MKTFPVGGNSVEWMVKHHLAASLDIRGLIGSILFIAESRERGDLGEKKKGLARSLSLSRLRKEIGP